MLETRCHLKGCLNSSPWHSRLRHADETAVPDGHIAPGDMVLRLCTVMATPRGSL